ncbi:MAG: hypothetical protein E7218_08180 [Anaerofustis stercorihominis]|nr:hypothetical protein [Anaerofustis stercorihominis]
MRYDFYDTDCTGYEEYDIRDEDYKKLIDICFKYCFSVAFRIWDDGITIPENLKKYNLPVDENVVSGYPHYYKELNEITREQLVHFKLSEDIRSYMCTTTNSIWGWINSSEYTNLEDPVFFRSDGSIFFHSVIHDGVCSLYPNVTEDVKSIVASGLWFLSED